MSNSYVGVSVKRKEDPALLTGKGKFVDDIHLNGMLHAVMVRSTYAHAVIKSIEATAALELDGVVAVITAADLPEEMRGACVPLLVPNAVIRHPRTPPILATDEVRYVGEAIAVVVAEDRYVAEDAAERVLVDYEPLPVVADVRQAIRPDAPVAHRDLEDDIACPMTQRYGDVEAAFASAAHVVEYACYQHRGSAHAMECRALIAEYDELNETMTLWSNTQTPHQYRGVFADMMDVPEQQVQPRSGAVRRQLAQGVTRQELLELVQRDHQRRQLEHRPHARGLCARCGRRFWAQGGDVSRAVLGAGLRHADGPSYQMGRRSPRAFRLRHTGARSVLGRADGSGR